jgi:ABC-type molybdate transport system ATPase subunit
MAQDILFCASFFCAVHKMAAAMILDRVPLNSSGGARGRVASDPARQGAPDHCVSETVTAGGG